MAATISESHHVPIIPNLGEHAHSINNFRNSQTGDIDEDAKAYFNTQQTQEELHTELNNQAITTPDSGYASMIVIISFAIIVVILIITIVWLILKYNEIYKAYEQLKKDVSNLLGKPSPMFNHQYHNPVVSKMNNERRQYPEQQPVAVNTFSKEDLNKTLEALKNKDNSVTEPETIQSQQADTDTDTDDSHNMNSIDGCNIDEVSEDSDNASDSD